MFVDLVTLYLMQDKMPVEECIELLNNMASVSPAPDEPNPYSEFMHSPHVKKDTCSLEDTMDEDTKTPVTDRESNSDTRMSKGVEKMVSQELVDQVIECISQQLHSHWLVYPIADLSMWTALFNNPYSYTEAGGAVGAEGFGDTGCKVTETGGI